MHNAKGLAEIKLFSAKFLENLGYSSRKSLKTSQQHKPTQKSSSTYLFRLSIIYSLTHTQKISLNKSQSSSQHLSNTN